MRVTIISGDPRFTAAATGLAGALGHQVDADLTRSDAVICDAVTINFDALESALDPLRTVVFFRTGADETANLLAGHYVHTFPRTALATALPEALALITAGTVG